VKKFLTLAVLVFIAFFSLAGQVYSREINEGKTFGMSAETKEVWQVLDGEKCGFFTGCSVAGQDVEIQLSGLSLSDGAKLEDGENIGQFKFDAKGPGCTSWPPSGLESSVAKVVNGSIKVTVPGNIIKTQCSYSIKILHRKVFSILSGDDVKTYKLSTPYSPPAQASCAANQCNDEIGVIDNSTYELCAQIQTGTPQYDACFACFTGGGIWTAVGCIPSQPESVIKVVITLGLALGGGVVLIMILVGSFMLSVSQGDPNKTKEAKEIITSAIIGLLFVIFSVTLLQFIGVSVLQIPGFGE
jgi:hypothetical protein